MKDIFLRVECFFFPFPRITSAGFVFVKWTGLRRDLTRHFPPFPCEKQPFVPARSSLEKSYNISKEPLQIETKFLRRFSQALVLRRTMAWTPWMLFGTPRSFEKPWRMMRSLETNGGISTNPPPFLAIDSINENLKEWKIGMKLKSCTVWCDFWLPLLDLDTEVCSGYWKPPSFLIALSTVPLASLARMEDL